MAKRPSVTVAAVLWQDAVYHNQDDTVQPEPMLTFGYVYDESDTYIRLASEIHADGNGRHFCVFPKHDMGGPRVIRVGGLYLPRPFTGYDGPRMVEPLWHPDE